MNFPFTSQEFFQVFADYNLYVWPAHILIYLIGASIIFLAFRPTKYSGKLSAFLLASLWLWMGVVYHWLFFSSLNPAARIFGGLYIIQAILFIIVGLRNKIDTGFRKNIYSYTGLGLVIIGTFIYPVIGYYLGHVYPYSPTFGLPCPTTIFTIGTLLMARAPRYLFFIPFIWSLIGFSVAMNFGVREDALLLVAGLTGLILIIFRGLSKKQLVTS